MMNKTEFLVVKGEKRFESLCKAKLGCVPYFLGTFAHVDGYRIEQTYGRMPTDTYYLPFYIFTNLECVCIDGIRDWIRERITNGTIILDKKIDYYKDILKI